MRDYFKYWDSEEKEKIICIWTERRCEGHDCRYCMIPIIEWLRDDISLKMDEMKKSLKEINQNTEKLRGYIIDFIEPRY